MIDPMNKVILIKTGVRERKPTLLFMITIFFGAFTTPPRSVYGD